MMGVAGGADMSLSNRSLFSWAFGEQGSLAQLARQQHGVGRRESMNFGTRQSWVSNYICAFKQVHCPSFMLLLCPLGEIMPISRNICGDWV